MVACLFAGCVDARERPDEARERDDGERALAQIEHALRPDSPERSEPPPRYDEGDEVVRYDSPGGAFRIHYTEIGAHAVPAGDGNQSGVPDAVELVAREYDAVLEFFRADLGYMPPRADAELASDHGGDGRFDVYLLDFPNSADGAFRAEGCTDANPKVCTGYMVQENDFDGRGYPSLQVATRVLASHELFHAVQSAYAADLSVVLGEATAVWASEAYDPTLDDFEGFVAGYLARPERSLAQEPSSAADAFSYGAALFFRRLDETLGHVVVRELWEELAGPAAAERSWTRALDAVLQSRHQTSLGEVFAGFARANLYTGSRADPAVSYAGGADYPEVAELAVALPYRDELLRMAPLSARYFVAPLGETRELVAAVTASAEDRRGLRLLLALERAGRIVELTESVDPSALRTALSAQAADRAHVAVIDTRTAGPTLHPALCIGAPADLAPCSVAAASGGPVAGGADTARPDALEDASAPTDAPTASSSRTDAAPDAEAGGKAIPSPEGPRDGGGCAIAPPRPRADYALAWLALAASLATARARSARALAAITRRPRHRLRRARRWRAHQLQGSSPPTHPPAYDVDVF